MDISSLRERPLCDALTVSELNQYVKRLFDGDSILSAVSVKGEISNFTFHKSGHLYFSLKDASGQIKCVMFKSSTMRLKFMPENGMKILARGSVSAFVRDGVYQLYVNSMEPDGVGALYLAYEQLKEKLRLEGLFDEIHKKPLPRYPMRIGVITSPSGAAVRDIINIAGRRFPLAKIYLYPALVQGDGAVPSLIKGIDYFEDSHLVDVIIIGRGGGSIEDLWAFNSELLARRIFDASTPIISAVGHETDFTICDFVADMRTPTPSAAAEMCVPDMREIYMHLDALSDRAERALQRRAEKSRERLLRIMDRGIFADPTSLIEKKREAADLLLASAYSSCNERIVSSRFSMSVLSEKLNALSPLSVLSRGYSVAEQNGRALKNIDEVSPLDKVTVRMTGGRITASVEKIEKQV